ncbi:hypothetical protein BY996DRAFT_6415727 [Phakopsora pachyrhizi]|nr:hypothetical protein BY996DRAFT_6415727 [Phakopsora pachyrhizi]
MYYDRRGSEGSIDNSGSGVASASISAKNNENLPNKHFSRTCPSLYQVNKRAPSESESDTKADKVQKIALQDSSPSLAADYPSSQYFSTSQGEGPSRSSHADPNPSTSRTDITIPNNELPQSLGSLLAQNVEVDSSPGKTEYRCSGYCAKAKPVLKNTRMLALIETVHWHLNVGFVNDPTHMLATFTSTRLNVPK